MIVPGHYWKTLPEFNEEGCLPWNPLLKDGIIGDDTPFENHRISPYMIGLREFERVFLFTDHRRKLYRSLQQYRRALREIGYVHGLHWVGGSYVEKTNKEPADIDITTFLRRPPNIRNTNEYLAFVHRNRDLHNRQYVKMVFCVDGTIVDIVADPALQDEIQYITQITSRYALYTHSIRTGNRKGFVAITFSEDDSWDRI